MNNNKKIKHFKIKNLILKNYIVIHSYIMQEVQQDHLKFIDNINYFIEEEQVKSEKIGIEAVVPLPACSLHKLPLNPTNKL